MPLILSSVGGGDVEGAVEVGGGYGYGGDGCGFSAQDAWAEGNGFPLVLGEERDFFWCPAAFRAYRQSQRMSTLSGGCLKKCWGG